MCWGDAKLCQTSTEQEYLEFNERETKTRSGNDPRNVKAVFVIWHLSINTMFLF